MAPRYVAIKGLTGNGDISEGVLSSLDSAGLPFASDFVGTFADVSPFEVDCNSVATVGRMRRPLRTCGAPA